MKYQFIISIFLLLTFFIILTGCESMGSRWEDAQSTNTIEAYEKFIKDYPKSPHVKQAKLNCKQFYFQDANQLNTMEAYEEFIKRYPISTEAKVTESKIIELRYKAIKQKNTIKDYRKFIEQYPPSTNTRNAQYEIISIYANKIKASKSLKDKEAIENNIVKDILKNGVGTRFILRDILPQNVNVRTLVTLAELDAHDDQKKQYNFTEIVNYKSTGQSICAQQDPNTDSFTFKTLYPKDKLYFTLSQFGAEHLEPLGNQCIWRFIGKIKFKGYVFYGNSKEPLTFMLLNNVGFVYLHGKGTVKKNKNHVATLP